MRGACAAPRAGLIPKNIFLAGMLTPRSKIRSVFTNNREKKYRLVLGASLSLIESEKQRYMNE